MARAPGDSWSAGRIETLTRMAADGHTAADVAVLLATSRSAVLGKAKRLGISFTGKAVPLPPDIAIIPVADPALAATTEVTVFEHPDCKRVDVAVAVPDPEPRRTIRATLIVVPSDAPKEEAPAPTELPSPPDGNQATQGEAMEAAPKTGPSPVGAASPVERRGTGKSSAKPEDIRLSTAFVVELTPPGWPKPAGAHAISLQDLREHHCRMPLWSDAERTGLFCGRSAEFGRAYCTSCRPLTVDRRQTRTVQERAANSAKFTAAGRTGAFA